MPARVTHVFATADAIGGVWTYALALARGLSGRGITTTLAVLGPAPDAGQQAAAAEIPGLDLVVTGAPLDWLDDDHAAQTAAARGLAALAAERHADVVHLNAPGLAALATWPAPVLGMCHSCLWSWWEAVGVGDRPEAFQRRGAALARGYAACDLLAAPSRSFADATLRLYGFLPIAVFNGIDPPAAAQPVPRRRQVLTAGRLWDAGKNVAGLDRAAARLDAPVLAAGPLVGPGGAAARLDHALALGNLSPAALRARMAESRVFASLARYEPFGLSVLEAAQAGCALVLANIPAFRELWGDAARFVPAGDDAACARALQGLLDDPAEAARLAEAARGRARRYSSAAMAAATQGLYASLPARRCAA